MLKFDIMLIKNELEIHLILANYFDRSPEGSVRKLDELTWQLRKAGYWQKLFMNLSDRKFYSRLYRHRQSDALGAWSHLENESSYRMIESYKAVLQDPSDFDEDILDVVANHLGRTGQWTELLTFREKLIENYARKGNTHLLAACLLDQASLHLQKGAIYEGLKTLNKLDLIIWRNREPWIFQEFLRVKSLFHWQKGELDEAMYILKIREQLCRKVPSFKHQLSGTLAHQSFILQLQGNIEDAEELLSESLRISREYGDLASYQSIIGEFGLILLKKGDMNGALEKFSEQELICREQGDLVSLAGCLGNIGATFSCMGKYTDSLNKFKEMEILANRIQHKTLYYVSRSMQAGEIYRTKSGEDAMAMIEEAVNFFRANGLAERLAESLLIQGHIYSFMLFPDKADRAYEEGVTILHKLSSLDEVADAMFKAGSHYLAVYRSHQMPMRGTFNYADFLILNDQNGKAEQYVKYALKYLENAIGLRPENASYYESYAGALENCGDINGAISACRQALQISPDWIDMNIKLADLLIRKETLL